MTKNFDDVEDDLGREAHIFARLLFSFLQRVKDRTLGHTIFANLSIVYRVAILDLSVLNISLHICAEKDATNLAQRLLKNGAETNGLDFVGSTPLHRAAEHGHVDVVRLLLDNHADVGIRDDLSRTPLHAALLQKAKSSKEVVSLLVKRNVDIEAKDYKRQTALCAAIRSGSLIIARYLLQRGADVEAKFNNDAGGTLLFDAAGRGHKSGVQLLLDEGANIEAINKNGDIALNVAVSRVGHSATQVLLEYHANPRHSNFHGSTALHLAVASPSMSIARSLLEAGANVDATDNDGQSPLHRTVIEGEEVHERILRLLIDHTAQVEIQDNDGNTPLHYAVLHERLKWYGSFSAQKLICEHQIGKDRHHTK
ncbi:hypothetical protein OEA41_008852 [Lepraria neglecta]|uniref:protein S-acyltransferase n=1 Tax=Lepraria neglecta TaxID=209136 RepID=A0AAD9Z0H6_9LECA|nr:hypothetical protein OEA41_008852 [Lepraria neglecta]